ERVLFHQLFADDDGIFKVVTIPRHEGDEYIAAQRQFTALCGSAVADDLSLLDLLAEPDHRALVEACPLVQADEFTHDKFLFVYHDTVGIDESDGAITLSPDTQAAVARPLHSHTGGNDRRFTQKQRHRLPLHVGTHQRPVGVVIFQERNEARRDADHLPRGNV